MNEELIRLPQARKERLVIQELQDEVLVYDLDRHEAHCLNETAAGIWRHCDGRSSIEDIAGLLPQKGETGHLNTDAVWMALEDLSRRSLLTEPVVAPPSMSSMSRREMLRLIGLTTVVALPVITSMVAPKAVAAASAGGPGAPCSSDVDCLSGRCLIPDGTCQ